MTEEEKRGKRTKRDRFFSPSPFLPLSSSI
jgi:hypothetical protein